MFGYVDQFNENFVYCLVAADNLLRRRDVYALTAANLVRIFAAVQQHEFSTSVSIQIWLIFFLHLRNLNNLLCQNRIFTKILTKPPYHSFVFFLLKSKLQKTEINIFQKYRKFKINQ